jgi:hypothetical protein
MTYRSMIDDNEDRPHDVPGDLTLTEYMVLSAGDTTLKLSA